MSVPLSLVGTDGYNKALAGDAESLFKAAIAVIEKYCGWHVAPKRVTTAVINGVGGTVLDLPTQRLVSLVSVQNDGVDIDLSKIGVSPSGTIELLSGTWSRRIGGIHIVFEHGFDDADDIASLAYTMAMRAQGNRRGAIQQNTDVIATRFASYAGGGAGGIVPFQSEYKVLDQYKLRVVS